MQGPRSLTYSNLVEPLSPHRSDSEKTGKKVSSGPSTSVYTSVYKYLASVPKNYQLELLPLKYLQLDIAHPQRLPI